MSLKLGSAELEYLLPTSSQLLQACQHPYIHLFTERWLWSHQTVPARDPTLRHTHHSTAPCSIPLSGQLSEMLSTTELTISASAREQRGVNEILPPGLCRFYNRHVELNNLCSNMASVAACYFFCLSRDHKCFYQSAWQDFVGQVLLMHSSILHHWRK